MHQGTAARRMDVYYLGCKYGMNFGATLLFYISFASLAEVIVTIEIPSIEHLFPLLNIELLSLLLRTTYPCGDCDVFTQLKSLWSLLAMMRPPVTLFQHSQPPKRAARQASMTTSAFPSSDCRASSSR